MRKEALAAILLFPAGEIEALQDWLALKLDEARADMETANDQLLIWRAQGKVQAIKNLINAITPKE